MRSNANIRHLGLLLSAPALAAILLVGTVDIAAAAKEIPTVSGSGECGLDTLGYRLFSAIWAVSGKGRWVPVQTAYFVDGTLEGRILESEPTLVDLSTDPTVRSGSVSLIGGGGTVVFGVRVLDRKGNPLTDWDVVSVDCPAP